MVSLWGRGGYGEIDAVVKKGMNVIVPLGDRYVTISTARLKLREYANAQPMQARLALISYTMQEQFYTHWSLPHSPPPLPS